MLGKLYLVATPIGNLQDISARALQTLETVDVIACEDTRHTGKLLKHFEIKAKLISYHDHNEIQRADEFSGMLSEGKSIAVVSDAGTPGIADPSFRIVQKAHEIGVSVIPIPGPVAFINAVIASGLPTDSIFFGGFLPSKKGERKRRLEEIKSYNATLAFYETPHRIAKCLDDCLEVLGNRKATVARELTKLHEEIIYGNLKDLAIRFREKKTKGEIVLVIDRKTTEVMVPETDIEHLVSERYESLQIEGIDHKKAIKLAAKEFGLKKSDAYDIIVKNKT